MTMQSQLTEWHVPMLVIIINHLFQWELALIPSRIHLCFIAAPGRNSSPVPSNAHFLSPLGNTYCLSTELQNYMIYAEKPQGPEAKAGIQCWSYPQTLITKPTLHSLLTFLQKSSMTTLLWILV